MQRPSYTLAIVNFDFFGLCQEREQKAEEERIRIENILSGNPLINLAGQPQPQTTQAQTSFRVKRRYLRNTCIL